MNLFGVYDGTRYLVFFGNEKYDFIYNRIGYLIQGKSGTTYVMPHFHAKIKVHSYDSLLLIKQWLFIMV